MNMDKRIAARRGRVVALDVDFYHGGELADPYAIRRIEIYKEQVLPHNLVEVIPLPPLHLSDGTADPLYPTPLTKLGVGQYQLPWPVPLDLEVPNVYQDVWYYYEDNPCLLISTGGTGGSAAHGTVGTDGVSLCNMDDPAFAPLLLASCHRFWAYPDEWWTDDRLQSVSFGFEPLNQKFNAPESRFLEVGLMPLPLYDFNYNLVAPMIPYLRASITVTTRHCETIAQDEPMEIGLRQGSFRTNPFVLRWRLDTAWFLIGTYRYKITIALPNGLTQTSGWFILTVN